MNMIQVNYPTSLSNQYLILYSLLLYIIFHQKNREVADSNTQGQSAAPFFFKKKILMKKKNTPKWGCPIPVQSHDSDKWTI